MFELHEYGDGVPFDVGGLRGDAVPALHYDELTFGFRVADGRSTLAYSGDSAPTDLAELARDADLFLCEATLAATEPARPAATSAPTRRSTPSAPPARGGCS